MIRRKEQALAVLRRLKRLYPKADCELDYGTPLELLMGVILSAQCTDVRVNMVTKTLFRRYRTAADYAAADPAELESIIRSTGFFRAKARSIRETARALVERHGGRVPDTMAELLELRGVARKTANVVLGTAFGKSEGIAVDTHVKRLAYRLGLTRRKDPVGVERDLMAIVPRRDWIFTTSGLIWHGRRVCKAVSPDCPGCALNRICPKRGV